MKENKKGSILKSVIAIVIIIILIALIGVLCYGYYKKSKGNKENPTVTMEVENYGTIKMELYPDKAPETVANFVKLASNGYYDGLKIHRVVKDFMIQGGDSKGDGTGSAKLGSLYGNDDETEYCIKGEFLANGYRENDLNLTEGTLAMARADYTQNSPTLTEESYNSAGTQFFIMTSNSHTSLSGYYAGFGKVTEGMDVVKKIEEAKVEASKKDEKGKPDESSEKSKPVKDIKIKSVKVDTHGVDYELPTTLEPFNYMNWLYSTYGISN